AWLAFASLVSRIPGVCLFRVAGGMVVLVTLGPQAPQELVQVVADGTTAILIILAMTFGLIVPKMCIEHFYSGFVQPNPPGSRGARIPGKVGDDAATDSLRNGQSRAVGWA